MLLSLSIIIHSPTHPCPALQALEGLRVVLGVRPQLLSVMVPRLIKPPITSTNLRALGALAEVAGAAIHPHLAALMPPLLTLASKHPDVSPAAAAAHQAVAAVALAVQVLLRLLCCAVWRLSWGLP
jgi:hypothetical protein